MATVQIPTEWKEAVCAILKSQDESKIEVTLRARLEWEATFPNASWSFVMYDEFRKYLSAENAVGRPVKTMGTPGEVYEFIFESMGRPIYGKINLKPSGELIMIYSAHPPLKGDEL